MDARQEGFENPFGMDESCTNCGRCDTRNAVLHGYGDVGAEFLFVAESPSEAADGNGLPLTGDGPAGRLASLLASVGLSRSDPDAVAAGEPPELRNAFLTYLARCYAPNAPTGAEIDACEPFLAAEIRMINPHIIVPIGEPVLRALATDYTTRSPGSFDIEDAHATTVRGRGFELVPMLALDRQDDADTAAFVDHFTTDVLGRDYRQTKGRRER